MQRIGRSGVIGHYPLQLRVLFFQLLQPLGFAHLQPAILAAPGIKRGRADTVLPAQLTRFGPCFALLQYPDDLFFIPMICSSLNLLFFTLCLPSATLVASENPV